MPSRSSQIHQQITEQVIAQLKSGGTLLWKRPWSLDPNCGAPKSLGSLRPYRGINVLILELANITKNYQSRWWGTFRQIKALGGYVRRGETATHVVLFKPITKAKILDTGEEVEETFPIMKTFPVFNCEQTGNLEHLWAGRTELAPTLLDERYEQADAVVAATAADIRFGGNDALYRPAGDYILLPFRHQFDGPTYYETLFHEVIHWTGHASRLNRNRANPDNSYDFEELVAELGSVFLCGELGLPTAETLTNHVAYVQNWLRGLQNDTGFIFRAAARASRATEFILSFIARDFRSVVTLAASSVDTRAVLATRYSCSSLPLLQKLLPLALDILYQCTTAAAGTRSYSRT